MHVSLIKIGNSQGIRLPKTIVEQLSLSEELDLQVIDDAVVIRNAAIPRASWAQAAVRCHSAGDDQFEDWDAVTSDFPEDF